MTFEHHRKYLKVLQLYYSINIVTSILLKIGQHARYNTS